MTIIRRLPPLLLTVVLSVSTAGCAFNLACEVFGTFYQARFPAIDVCSSFNGECCGDEDGDGFPDECSGFFGSSPCGRFDTAGCFCFGGGEFTGIGQTLVPEPLAYAVPPSATFFVSLPYAGLSSAHRAFFDTTAQDLQTRHAVITYPDAFGFNGFLALGPPETVVGALGVDFNLDFEPDLSLALRGLTADTAYVDGDGSGGYNAADPLLVHTVGSHVFTVTMPRGGDGLARTKIGRIPLRMAVALYGGILVNPATPDVYTVTGTFTSVDPDSGDGDDGVGTAPTTFPVTVDDVTIEPASFGNLSPFLCYATKPTKSLVCSGAAAVNAGGACTTDAECGATPGTCVKTPLAKGLAVAVEDGFDFAGPRSFTVAKPATLCTPAELDGTGLPFDQAAHFRGYQVKPAKGTAKHEPLLRTPIVNQLGTVIIDTKKPDRVLAVSAKALDAPAAALGATDVDDFKCYTVKVVKKRCAQNSERKCKKSADCGVDGPCLAAFPKTLTVAVGDQLTTFATPRTLQIVKPTRLCFPAAVNGGAVGNVAATLLCYQTKPAAGTPKHAKLVGRIHTTNPLARERADTVKESELCLPSVFAGVT